MMISNQCMVTIHYRLTDHFGTVIDASAGKEPLQYLHGARKIIPGLEKELTGKVPGDQLEIEIQPKDGYGNFDPKLIKTVPFEAFAGMEPLEPGMCFETQRQDGQKQLMTIKKLTDQGVLVDENHPLAGKILRFDVSVIRVRQATREELAEELVAV